MALTPTDFAAFFGAIHGHAPFPWQRRLVEQIAHENRWPDVLDLPSGTGKTAALDVAVFHLALQADRKERYAPLRIVLVVDRLLVVDDADRRARKIACALRDPARCPQAGRGVVSEVAQRLQRIAGIGGPPLVAEWLRAGAPLEHDWAHTPTQPTILCSTVDQVGSRLLFRGYGVSDRMKPVHAGLLGEDSLILLDEAHLSEPFRQTLQAVRTVGGANVTPVVLTATAGGCYKRPFRLGAGDRADSMLKVRLGCAKPARLMKPVRTDPTGAFALTAREMAKRLRREGVAAPAVGVVVNRVDLARAIFERLRETVDATVDCLLLIGRSRDVDRRGIERTLAPFRTGNYAERAAAAPLMVVATQCLEVGIDLDLDGLVTEGVPLDVLRQRFGRVNRGGRAIKAAGAVLTTTESLAKRTDDPIYGDRLRRTWDMLTAISKRERVDFGVDALDLQLQRAKIEVADYVAPRAQAPVLMPAYLDLWAQTSPAPATDPEVELFLHGTERTSPEVSIVWRSDISDDDLVDAAAAAKLKTILALVPPRSAEMLEVPVWVAAAWLRRWSTARTARLADVVEPEDDLEIELSETDRPAFRWAGASDPRTGLVKAGDLRGGDVLVVPAQYGGCDRHGWAPASREPVADVADAAAWPYRGCRYVVRVTPKVAHWDRLFAVLTGTDDPRVDDLVAALPVDEDLDAVPEAARASRIIRQAFDAFENARGGIAFRYPYGERSRGVVVVASSGLKGAPRGYQPVTEDDEASRRASRPITLKDHTCAVVRYVDRSAATLGLMADQEAGDLRLAARLHDLGKADERFQLMLVGAGWWNRPDGPALAKSGRSLARGAAERAGLPTGWRHEARSVHLALTDPRFVAHDPFLVLWLIGTHHGYGRPFFSFHDPLDVEGPQSLGYTFEGCDWPTVFERLRRRYGVWRLAWLEAVLRLADHRASEETERE